MNEMTYLQGTRKDLSSLIRSLPKHNMDHSPIPGRRMAEAVRAAIAFNTWCAALAASLPEHDYGINSPVISRSERASSMPKKQPTRAEAEEAVRILIRWAGDDPEREGLTDTPARVARAYEDWFSGYTQDPAEQLQRTFEEVGGFDEIVILRAIPFESHCEHHMAPIIGHVHIGYLPNKRVIGISKLARLVDAYARRLQVQERLTAEIADTLNAVLKPRGVAVIVDATHQCMTTRGVHKQGVSMVTSRMLGAFRDKLATRQEFLAAVGLR